jgi:zinc protease
VPRGAAPDLPPQGAGAELPRRVSAREPREQAIVLLGYPGIPLNDERMEALSLLARTLSGMSSDLGIEIREKRGLVYYVGAFNQPGLHPGLFALYAGTREDAAGEVERLMREQVDRIVREGPRDEEWQRAREQAIAANDMAMQSNAEMAQICALNELYGLGYAYALEVPARLNALTREQLREAAASVLDARKEAVSVVLPASQTEEKP